MASIQSGRRSARCRKYLRAFRGFSLTSNSMGFSIIFLGNSSPQVYDRALNLGFSPKVASTKHKKLGSSHRLLVQGVQDASSRLKGPVAGRRIHQWIAWVSKQRDSPRVLIDVWIDLHLLVLGKLLQSCSMQLELANLSGGAAPGRQMETDGLKPSS
jgi:hypothetical protein